MITWIDNETDARYMSQGPVPSLGDGVSTPHGMRQVHAVLGSFKSGDGMRTTVHLKAYPAIEYRLEPSDV